MKKIVVIFPLVALIFTQARAQGIVRIEDDFNLAYPEGRTDEIVDYLKNKYVVDQSFVRAQGAEFTSSFGDEDFTDTYFDTANLDLYQRRAGLRYRIRIDRSDPSSHRELVQLKLSGDDKFADTGSASSRNELKFEVPGLAAALKIEDFRVAIGQLGIDPGALKPILTIEQRRQRVYLNRSGATFISFSMDDAQSRLLWADASFSQMEIELNELVYTGASEAEREKMRQTRENMIADLRGKFDYLQDDSSIKYTKMFDLLQKRLPFLRFMIKFDLQDPQTFYAALVLILFAFIAVGYWFTRYFLKPRHE